MSPSREAGWFISQHLSGSSGENTFRLNLTEPKLLLMCLKEELRNCLTWLCEATPCSFFPENSRFRNIRICVRGKLLQLCLTLCDPMDCSPPGSSIHRILNQCLLCLLHWQLGSLGLAPPRKSIRIYTLEGNGNPLQCSCLENPLDRGAWWATVHGVA